MTDLEAKVAELTAECALLRAQLLAARKPPRRVLQPIARRGSALTALRAPSKSRLVSLGRPR